MRVLTYQSGYNRVDERETIRSMRDYTRLLVSMWKFPRWIEDPPMRQFIFSTLEKLLNLILQKGHNIMKGELALRKVIIDKCKEYVKSDIVPLSTKIFSKKIVYRYDCVAINKPKRSCAKY